MMNVIIPFWHSRVSPVFDVANRLLIVSIKDGREIRRDQQLLIERDLMARVRHVTLFKTDVLICGAISRPLEFAITAAGVRVISNICGPVEEVLEAFLGGHLADGNFFMPGCCKHRRRFRGSYKKWR